MGIIGSECKVALVAKQIGPSYRLQCPHCGSQNLTAIVEEVEDLVPCKLVAPIVFSPVHAQCDSCGAKLEIHIGVQLGRPYLLATARGEEE